MKIGLFGGSFDPITKAHVEIAKIALSQLELDEIQFIPTAHNPWKDQNNASKEDRIHMIEIAIKDTPHMTINHIEIDNDNNDKNYTYQTIEKIISSYPDNEYYYIMGMDQANLFYKWKHPKRISKMVQLVAFKRGGYKSDKKILKKYHFIKLKNKPITASSSDVRCGHIELLNDDVLRYISSTGIYLNEMIQIHMKEKRWKHSCSVAKLAKEFASSNGLNETEAYIAGILHDIAKELDHQQALDLMNQYYPEYVHMSEAIWHQWLSAYMAKNLYLIDDEVILKAIEDHTTASTTMSAIGKCLYCADKLDPLRGYDSSKQIEVCKTDIHQGFRDALEDFYTFSKEKGRNIDPVFFEIYEHYCIRGEIE
ncbi:MAG: nicotinate-nucleotide adenylyltransferase [Erysipelotrichaceae bacterium]|nr:nicotinate-nucleotide adenylyltransferase [Erysipelotrichaceae bacterium]